MREVREYSHRSQTHKLRSTSGDSPRDDPRQRLQPKLVDHRLARDDVGSGSIGDPTRVSSGDDSSLLESWRKTSKGLHGSSDSRVLVGEEVKLRVFSSWSWDGGKVGEGVREVESCSVSDLREEGVA